MTKIQLTYFFTCTTKNPVTYNRAISEKRQHLKKLFCSRLLVKILKTKTTTTNNKKKIENNVNREILL